MTGQTGREILSIRASRRGLFEITGQVGDCLRRIADHSCRLLHLFLPHTSASLLIQENADPSARHDLELFMERLVPFHQPGFLHTAEGPDDMPSHIKTTLTQTSLTIPCQGPRLLLGTWQGIYLWEHRDETPNRNLIVSTLT